MTAPQPSPFSPAVHPEKRRVPASRTLPPEKVRSVAFVVRLRPSERDDLAVLADNHGMALSNFVRHRLLEWSLPRPQRTADEARMYATLSQLSVAMRNAVGNLNGLARAYHSGFPIEADELGRALAEVRAEVETLRRALAGG